MTDKTNRPLVSVISESVVGGVARHVELIAEEIPKRNVGLHVILSCERRPDYLETVESFRNSGIDVDVVPMLRRPAPISDIKPLATIRSLLKSKTPTVVHTHSSKAGILGRRAAASLGIPTLHTPHVFAFEWETGWRRMVYRRLERMAAGWSSGIVALSERQRMAMLADRICEPGKIHLIPNGVSCEIFHPPSPSERAEARARLDLAPAASVIGVAARLEPQKGMGHFLRAVVRIRERLPDVVILIAGTGSMEEECRRRVVELGIADSVRFCGEVADMVGFYHALDCFMLASLWEGLPYVVLEAMACQLPVVATRSFGCDGLTTDGETGVLVDVGDVEGLAEAAIHIVTNPSVAIGLGERARSVVERRFSLAQWADDLAALYRNLSDFEPRNG